MYISISNKKRVAILLSCVIALVYSLPWLAFGDQPRTLTANDTPVLLRVSYLFLTVFITSAIFFFSHSFFKKVFVAKQRVIRLGAHITIHAVVILVCTCVLLII